MNQDNKEIIRRWVAVVNNPHSAPTEFAGIWAASCVVHPGGGMPEVRGIDELQTLLAGFRLALPDLAITTEDLVADGDRVAARFTTRGTQTGPLLQLAASGKRIEMSGFAIFRIAEGRIAEEWLLDDLMSLMAQVAPTPRAAQP